MSRRLLALGVGLLLAPELSRAASFEVEALPPAPGQPRILLARRPGRLATIRILFGAGAVEDGERRGLTRLTQHALLAANRRLDHEALLLDVHAAAADLRVETGVKDSAFVLTADRRDFPRLAKQLAAAVLSPRLDSTRYSRAAALAMIDGRQPGGGATLLSLVASLTMDDGRYLNEPFGERGALESLTFDDVAEHLDRFMSPAQATVIVTGRFDRDDMLRFLRGFRGGRATVPSRPNVTLPIRIRKRAENETYLLGYSLQLSTPRDAAAARLAAALIDTELWKRFRDAGVGYTFTVTPVRTPWLDMLLVLLPAHDPSALDLSSHVLDVIERVRTGRFDDARLDHCRKAALAELEEEDRDPGALARALSRHGETWHGPKVVDALRAMGRAEFIGAISPALERERSLFAYFGPSP